MSKNNKSNFSGFANWFFSNRDKKVVNGLEVFGASIYTQSGVKYMLDLAIFYKKQILNSKDKRKGSLINELWRKFIIKMVGKTKAWLIVLDSGFKGADTCKWIYQVAKNPLVLATSADLEDVYENMIRKLGDPSWKEKIKQKDEHNGKTLSFWGVENEIYGCFVLLYRKRWSIEECFKELKSYLCFETFKRKKGQRGKIKKQKGLNLLERLEKREESLLGFLDNFSIPFDNNLAERDLRVVKTRTKISGCFRSEEGSQWFCRFRSYISTLKKQNTSIYPAIQSIFKGDLLLPEV